MTHLTTIYKIVVNTKNSHPSPKKIPITSSHPLHDLPQLPQTYSTLYLYDSNELTTAKLQIKYHTFLCHTSHNFNLNKMTSNSLYNLDPPQKII